MTMKHTDKNISAENEDIVKDIDLQSNGTLKITKKNLYSGQTSGNNDSKYLDLGSIKLRILKITQQELEDLEESDNPEDISLREANIFLIPLDNDDSNDSDEYKEMIWSTDKEAFEQIGTTRIDLNNYIQKSQTAGFVKNDGSIDGNNYLTTSSASSTYATKSEMNNKVDTVSGKGLSTNDFNNNYKALLDDIDFESLTITYDDNGTDVTETITFLIINNSS